MNPSTWAPLYKSQDRKGKAQAAGHALWKMLTGDEIEEESISADTSEIHLLEHAFKRRGLLFETAGLMSYVQHEQWRRRLFKAMHQEVAYVGESAPGVADILRADSRIRRLLAEETLDGIPP